MIGTRRASNECPQLPLRSCCFFAAAINFVAIAANSQPHFECAVLSPPVGASSLPARVGDASTRKCSGTCVIDVAFSYYPEAMKDAGLAAGRVTAKGYPKNPRELRNRLELMFKVANSIYRASNTGTRFRLVSVEPMGDHTRRPAGNYDLWYAVDPMGWSFPPGFEFAAGWGVPPVRDRDGTPVWGTSRRSALDGGFVDITLGDPDSRRVNSLPSKPFLVNGLPIWTFHVGTGLAHEFGHNLGLHHGVGRKPGMSEWEGGNGFLGQWGETDSEWYSTVMSWGAVRCTELFNPHDGSECWKASSRLGRFSSATDTLSWDDEGVGEFDEVFLQTEWTLGNSEADAVSVIRRNAPYLAARGPRNRTAPPPPEFEIDDGRPDDQPETPKPPPPPPDDGPEHEAHSETVAWLNDDRHAVAVEFDEKGDDVTYRDARVLDVDLPGDQSAILYFYTPDNAEMLVKVLDGCAFNDHWWVFAASATDRPFQLTVEDVRRNTSKVYFNEGGHGAAAITDTAAFPCSLGR